LLDAAKASPGDVESLEVAIQAAAAAKLDERQMEAEQSLQKLDHVCMLLGMLCGRSPAGEAVVSLGLHETSWCAMSASWISDVWLICRRIGVQITCEATG